MKDIEQVGPDNRTIKGRLEELSTQTAQDIKNCSNTCDTYLKKKLVVKIFAGPIWEGKLLGFVELFMQRRQEYGWERFRILTLKLLTPISRFSLTVHTSLGVDEANIRLASVAARTEEIAIKCVPAWFRIKHELTRHTQHATDAPDVSKVCYAGARKDDGFHRVERN